MVNKLSYILIVLIISTLLTSCNGEKMPEPVKKVSSIKDFPAALWEELSNKRIYFGHQSVGYNILDGIKDLMKENLSIHLNIIETQNISEMTGGIFAHSKIGQNQDYKSKLDHFTQLMSSSLGDRCDIAFFKFCYVDINTETNIEKVLQDYINAIDFIKQKYPDLMIVHVTVPLRTVQAGLKAWLKKIIGRQVGGYSDNIKRNQYNRSLRKKYLGKAPFFDLALIESTFPDGSRSIFTYNGVEYFSLVEKYSDDGKHLNNLGRKNVAEHLLITLAGIQ